MSEPSHPASYIAAIVTLYVELPDTPLRASVSDQWLARRFHDDGVPLQVAETALLLGSLRRLIRPADGTGACGRRPASMAGSSRRSSSV